MGDFYGDPKCGLIAENDNWCVVGGEILNVGYKDKGLLTVEDEDLKWIQEIRHKSSNEIALLIDPWSEKVRYGCFVWKL